MTPEQPRWPLEELARQVATALGDEPGPASGRVRAVPDARAIRWYTTIGLVDKPAGYRGRTAVYGPRHLWQLVAVKRRQAQGMALADIQAELSGASDERLRAIAGIDVPPAETASPPPAPSRRRASEASRATEFWRRTPVDRSPAAGTGPSACPTVRYAVPLSGGVTVVLTSAREPDAADLTALTRAAEPLLRVVAERDLINHEGEPSP